MPQTATLGAEFASALGAKDFDAVRELIHPEVDFKGVTPRRNWEASDPESLVSGVLRQWFDDEDEIVAVEGVETDAFADRDRVGYRFRVRTPQGTYLVEQQVYLAEREGRIGWMRSVCSGFRPVEG